MTFCAARIWAETAKDLVRSHGWWRWWEVVARVVWMFNQHFSGQLEFFETVYEQALDTAAGLAREAKEGE